MIMYYLHVSKRSNPHLIFKQKLELIPIVLHNYEHATFMRKKLYLLVINIGTKYFVKICTIH